MRKHLGCSSNWTVHQNTQLWSTCAKWLHLSQQCHFHLNLIKHIFMQTISMYWNPPMYLTYPHVLRTGTTLNLCRGENCVIDWKTSSRPKPSLDDCFDFPLQVVAYAGAINQDKHYPFKVHKCVCMHACMCVVCEHARIRILRACHLPFPTTSPQRCTMPWLW